MQALRLRGDISQVRCRRGRYEGWVVVLTGGKDVKANLFGFECNFR